MKPATPLPWTWMRGVECGWRLHGGNLEGKREFVLRTVPSIGGKVWTPKPADAQYLAHAANAYPKLVGALRAIADTMIAQDMPKSAESINALLKELGE